MNSVHRDDGAALGEKVAIQRVGVDLILQLRHRVLRQQLPIEAAHFPGDGLATTFHLAALAAQETVSCASFMQVPYQDEPAYQLRGMATAAPWRGRGLGSRLLEQAEVLLRDDPIRLRWCNARSLAVIFYQKQGWQVVSPEFDIPTAGPHFIMIRRI